ncbi:spore coat protein SP96-like [Procambarus clarkii]|uniref:spore coat protein SP96-like n=1 Tax=Procambarus clarkii TaxID=6728 RepID=UPI00374487C9
MLSPPPSSQYRRRQNLSSRFQHQQSVGSPELRATAARSAAIAPVCALNYNLHSNITSTAVTMPTTVEKPSDSTGTVAHPNGQRSAQEMDIPLFAAEMKRNVLSGAQKRKRKRAAEEKENIGKLPKLSSWLNTGAMTATQTIPSDIASTSASTPAVSATSTLPSDITSTPAMSTTSTVPSDITSTSTSIPATIIQFQQTCHHCLLLLLVTFYKRKYPKL